jgi:ATP-dependent Zn protease
MMATNLPQALDEALLRPGRIDRMYKVGYPSKDGRKRTYQGYFDKVSHQLTDDQIEKLSVITPYATGATIKDLVNEALIIAIREGRDTITWADVIKAKHLKTLGPGEDVEYVNRERHAIAVHEACHAVAAFRLRRHMEIDIATIEKGGTYLGMVSSIPPDDQFTRWRSEYEVDIKVALASLAGERLFFDGDNSSGVSGDLNSATTIATMMEGFWGMGETISSYAVARQVIGGGGGPGGPRPGGEDEPEGAEGFGFNQTLGKRIEDNLRRLFEETEQLLDDNRREVLAMAHALEIYKTLSGEDVAAVIDGTVGPLVDGRVYTTPEFLAAAEHYHAVAVTAHASHSTVPVPIPDWRPTPELVAAGDGNDGTPLPDDPFGYPAAPPVAGGGAEGGNGSSR